MHTSHISTHILYKYTFKYTYLNNKCTYKYAHLPQPMSVSDLKGGDNFLLYYQGIDTTSAVCQTPKTKRGKVPKATATPGGPAPKKKRKR